MREGGGGRRRASSGSFHETRETAPKEGSKDPKQSQTEYVNERGGREEREGEEGRLG
jgi:hypothetical protein